MAQEPETGPEVETDEGEEFGTCCNELREAMSGNEFEPLIVVGDDGILYMSVGLIDIEGEEPGMVDHLPVLRHRAAVARGSPPGW